MGRNVHKDTLIPGSKGRARCDDNWAVTHYGQVRQMEHIITFGAMALAAWALHVIRIVVDALCPIREPRDEPAEAA
jgi:hypothetical protein